MNIKIPLVSSLLHYFVFFWKSARFMLPLFVALSFLCGVMEGFGIMLVVPLLDQANISNAEDNKIGILFQKVFDVFGISLTMSYILLFIAVAFLIKGILVFFCNLSRIYMKTILSKEWKLKLVSLYGKLNYKYYLDSDTGFFSNIIITESGRAVSAFSSYCMLLTTAVNIMIFLSFSFFISWKFTFIGLFVGGTLMYAMKWIFKMSVKYSQKTSVQNAVLQGLLIQTIQSFKYLKATDRFMRLQNKITNTINDLVQFEIRQGIIRWILRTTLEVSAIWLVLGLIFIQVSIRGNSFGSTIILVLFFYRAVKELNKLQVTWNGFCDVLGGGNYVIKSI
ncbi:MAG: ABC transporter transmembrane domain-containing protein [Candidatus Scalindua sp.]